MANGSSDVGPDAPVAPGVAIVTGTGGQDGSLLVENLLDTG